VAQQNVHFQPSPWTGYDAYLATRGSHEEVLQGQWQTRQLAKPQGDKAEASERVRQST